MPYPVTEPHTNGMLEVGYGNSIYWEISGSVDGKPALLLHGGPGTGSSPRHRQMFNPEKYAIVQFDQRNCGRSTPSASVPRLDLSQNTTQHLIADIELLRATLGIDSWLVWGGSWGTTLGLAYAQAQVDAVSELILGSVVTSTRAEVEWIAQAMRRIFPERWKAFCDFLPAESRHGDLAAAYHRILMDPDPTVHAPAADAWCEWEDTHVSIAEGYQPALRNEDPEFRLCFARLVTHYWANAGFIDDGQLMRNAHTLGGVPTFLIHGRMDISSPADIAFALSERIPNAELFIAETEGHGGPTMYDHTVSITDRLAS